jgi:Flp pilus assembly protein TadD
MIQHIRNRRFRGFRGMTRVNIAAPLLFALGLLLSACSDTVIRLDPFSVEGRDGGGAPIGYNTLMRIGAAAHAGGDLPNALSIFRRAAAAEPTNPAPVVAAASVLLEMGQADEAIVTCNSALALNPHEPEALRGLAKAYMKTGRPELAAQPLAVAFQDTPEDPRLLLLIGVADDFSGQHGEAQARYRRGLELRPGDPALSLNLALSMALTEQYSEAITVLRPVAMSSAASQRDRQTLALIYGLKGDRAQAAQLGRRDLDTAAVEHNLAYYDTLRRLPPDARSRAVLSLGRP